MGYLSRGIIFNISNTWAFRDFSLGFSIATESCNELREYYLVLSLGFIQIVAGFRI